MKEVVRIILLSLVPTLALAQNEPVVSSIVPFAGPPSGGTEVTITGDRFAPSIVCILPCPTTVLFGTTEVTPKSATNTRLVVITPPHAAGSVDVTISVPDGRKATVRNGFTYSSSQQGNYETLLLPVYLDGRVAGANGSQWQTDLWIHNDGKSAATLAPWDCPANQICPAVFPLTRTLEPGESLHNLPAFFRPPAANPSRLLYVSRNQSQDVAMQLRLADVSRGALNGGTELPVVRESELLDSTASLLNVPFDSRFRLMLRVYDIAKTQASFRVNIYAQEASTSQAPLYTFELAASTNDSGDFRLTPAYAQFALDELLQLKRTWPPAVRLEILPLSDGSLFWAFVSATNNDTQLVTLTTPQ